MNDQNHLYEYDYTGTGTNVFVLDTGIHTSHTDFGGRAFCFRSFVEGDDEDDCEDVHGHGTRHQRWRCCWQLSCDRVTRGGDRGRDDIRRGKECDTMGSQRCGLQFAFYCSQFIFILLIISIILVWWLYQWSCCGIYHVIYGTYIY